MSIAKHSRKLFIVCEDGLSDLGQLKEIIAANKEDFSLFIRNSYSMVDRIPIFDPTLYGGLILLGGAGESGTNRIEQQCLRIAIANECPVLGICQGAQLLAEVCQKRRRTLFPLTSRHQGLSRLQFLPACDSDHLLKPLIELDALVMQDHGWGFRSPDNTIPLAISPDGTHCEAFKLNRITYGVQFHPEVQKEDMPEWFPRSEPHDGAFHKSAECGGLILQAWFDLFNEARSKSSLEAKRV